MIRRTVKVQLIVFLLLSAAGITYTGLTYVGFHIFNGPYTVTAYFPDSGGIFTNAAVTYRGVPVGQVGAMSLAPHGVAVQLKIDHQYDHIPALTDAVVANLSAVGEQYVDLQPLTAAGPYLHNGSTIPMSRTSIPLDDATLLLNLDQLVNSVNRSQLVTMIDELGRAFAGTGPDLQRLIDSGDELTQAAQQNLPTDITLLNDGRTVLDTQQAVSGDLKIFAANLASFSGQLVTSDPDLRALFSNGVASAQQLSALLSQNTTSLGLLFGNLITLGQIQAARVPGLKIILALYPGLVTNGFLTAGGPCRNGATTCAPALQQGYAHFGLVTNNSPPPCYGPGYNTPHRSASTSAGYGGAANLNAYCLQPRDGGSTMTDRRGARNVPRPPGDDTGSPPPGGYQQEPGSSYPAGAGAPSGGSGGGSGSGSAGAAAPTTGQPGQTSGGGLQPAPYDPLSGLLSGPNGQMYMLGDQGGQARYLGSQSWEWLLIAPAVG